MSIGGLTVFLSQLHAAFGDDFGGFEFLDTKIRETQERIAASERFLSVLRQKRSALEIAPYETD